MSRPAIKQRASSAIPSASHAGDHPHPDVFKAVIKDITTGTKSLVSQSSAAAGAVKSGFQKVKDFLSK